MTFDSLVLWATIAIPGIVGVALLLWRPQRAAAAIALVTAAATMLFAVLSTVRAAAASAPFLAGADLALRIDSLGALFLPVVAGVTLVVLVFASASGMPTPARFHGLMLLFAAAALVTVAAENLLTLLLAWEVMGATSCALIGFRWWEQRRMSSGLTAFLVTRTADLGLYLAAGLAIGAGVGLTFDALPTASSGWREAIAAGIALAALGKAAQLPFSFWLSRAMDGPSPVSALLHSAAMVALGAFLVLRISPLLTSAPIVAGTVAWIGVATALVLGAVAWGQEDLKQLLAASTAAQMGFAVVAAAQGAVAPGVVHLMAHAATKAALFLAAGAWLGAWGTKRLAGLSGAARRWPWIGWAFAAGAVTLAGIPPFALWWTKDGILAVAQQQTPVLHVVGVAAAALSAGYAARALTILVRTRPASAERYRDEEETGSDGVPRRQQAAVLVLAFAACVAVAIAVPPAMAALQPAVGGRVVSPSAVEMTVSAVLGVAVAALAALLVVRGRSGASRWAVAWLGLEKAAHASFVRPTTVAARALAAFDERVLAPLPGLLAGIVHRSAGASASLDDAVITRGGGGIARGTEALARSSVRLDERGIHSGVRAVARGVRNLGARARLPQTGLVHQYYVQAVAILALAGVFVLVVVLW